jgi:hypothetical protein
MVSSPKGVMPFFCPSMDGSPLYVCPMLRGRRDMAANWTRLCWTKKQGGPWISQSPSRQGCCAMQSFNGIDDSKSLD